MQAIFKSLINALSKINTPLIFWAFMLLLLVVVFYIFSKYNIWFLKTSIPVINKLAKNALYKITKRIIMLVFIFLLILIFLAFVVPLINNIFEKKYDKDVIYHVEESKQEVIEKIDLDEKYKEIIDLYEAGKTEHSKLLIEEVFNKAAINNSELKGYLVSSYFANGDYKKAAIQVLERDREKTVWDLSLKNDLAQCVRSYSIKNGQIKGLELVKELQKKYGFKLISVFWIAIPIEYLRLINLGYFTTDLENGIDDDTKNEIMQLIDLFPNDKFIDHAFLALNKYESILKINPSSRLSDLALFGLGYKIISENRNKHFTNLAHNIGNDYYMRTLISKESIDKEGVDIEKAIQFFSRYINISTKLPQADDACYWLGWLYAQQRKFEKAMEFLFLAQTVGNHDYALKAEDLQYYLINFLPVKDRIAFFKKINIQKINYAKQKQINYLVKKIDPIEAMRIVLSDTSLFHGYIINQIVENQLKNYGNLSNCIKLYSLYNNVITNQLLKNVYSAVYIDKLNDKLIKKIARIKRDPACRILCDQIIDKVMIRAKDYDIEAKLIYLKIKIAEFEYSSEVEKLVKNFLLKYSKHDLADDVLAEMIYFQANVLRNFTKAELNFNQLIKTYPNGNAIDNASFWLAYGYEQSNTADHLKIAKSKYLEIIKKYPYTRFARYAKRHIK
jgi:hypothetical protein